MLNKPKKEKKEINLIPMINIIFLLLIFFMLTGVIEKKNIYIIDRPHSIFAEKDKKEYLNQHLISLEQNGNMYLNNKLISVDSLKNNTIFRNPIEKITLDIDKNLELGNLRDIMVILKNNNIKKLFVRSTIKDE